jgi:transcriptional regulator with XRE-family HTH domain
MRKTTRLERRVDPNEEQPPPARMASALGRKLKKARRQRDMTLKAVALAARVSEGHLSKIENDKAAPSLAVLHRIAGVLGINLAHFFDETGERDAVVFRAGDRPVITLDALRSSRGVALERIIPHWADNVLQCNIHIIEPGGASEGQIAHEGEEVGMVLEGSVDLRLEERTIRLAAGDAFHFRSERPHGYRNPGIVRARIFWVNTPPTF